MQFFCFNNYSSLSSYNNQGIDINWIQWLIGFLDAEGNFQTFPKKRVRKDGTTYYNIGYGIHLGLHLKEKVLIEDIRSKLGNIGTTPTEFSSNKNEVHFAMNYLGNL